MIRYLVSKGADVKAVNREGQTTVDMANGPVQRVQPWPDTIKFLESLGAKTTTAACPADEFESHPASTDATVTSQHPVGDPVRRDGIHALTPGVSAQGEPRTASVRTSVNGWFFRLALGSGRITLRRPWSGGHNMSDMCTETDSLGVVDVPADKLWGPQTQRSIEYFSIGKDVMPREMIASYAILKKAAATANHDGGRLDAQRYTLIVQACNEILAGQHHDMFPLHVWMTGSGTQFNMNVNEVISNRCCQLAGTALGSKTPVHPNDHVNMSQSSNDSFPSAMSIAAAVNVKQRLIPALTALHTSINDKAHAWKDIVRSGGPICRTPHR